MISNANYQNLSTSCCTTIFKCRHSYISSNKNATVKVCFSIPNSAVRKGVY